MERETCQSCESTHNVKHGYCDWCVPVINAETATVTASVVGDIRVLVEDVKYHLDREEAAEFAKDKLAKIKQGCLMSNNNNNYKDAYIRTLENMVCDLSFAVNRASRACDNIMTYCERKQEGK